MKLGKVLLRGVTLRRAVTELTAKKELWRSNWSVDVVSDEFHHPLRLHDADGRLMSVSARGSYWGTYSLTVQDILARNWEVRRVVD